MLAPRSPCFVIGDKFLRFTHQSRERKAEFGPQYCKESTLEEGSVPLIKPFEYMRAFALRELQHLHPPHGASV